MTAQRWNIDEDWLRRQVRAMRSNADIANDVGCSAATIAKAVGRFDLAGIRQPPRPELRNELLANAAWMSEQVEAGCDVADIAAASSASRQTVRTWLQRHGLDEPPRSRPASRIGDRQWLAGRIGQGRTALSIAQDAGVSSSTVTGWIARHGLGAEWAENKRRRGGQVPELGQPRVARRSCCCRVERPTHRRRSRQ